MPADRVFVDTNVLLAASDEGRRDHVAAVSVLGWPTSGTTLYCSCQVLREYLAVATRPVLVNGLGFSRSDAVANVRELRGVMRVLEDTTKVTERLLDLVEVVDCTGKQVHDANIVASMAVHGLDVLVTRNGNHFARFSSLISVLDPVDAVS